MTLGPMKHPGGHAMDDNTMEMQFQDIMEFVACEQVGEIEREAPMIQFDEEQKAALDTSL